jgi:hypothetical protein
MGLLLPQHRDGMPQGWEHKLGRIREIAERQSGCRAQELQVDQAARAWDAVARAWRAPIGDAGDKG